jgi:hypothetical protein
MKTTDLTITPAPAYLAVPRLRPSTWAAPVQGIRMSTPATQLAYINGAGTASCTTATNVATGADRKGATGVEAFEDPL